MKPTCMGFFKSVSQTEDKTTVFDIFVLPGIEMMEYSAGVNASSSSKA